MSTKWRRKRTTRCKEIPRSKVEAEIFTPSNENQTRILDIPDEILEEVLLKLSVPSILQMSLVCKEFYVKCTSDRLWRMLFQEKWGKLIDPETYSEWKRESTSVYASRHWMKLRSGRNSKAGERVCRSPMVLPTDSFMAWYMALEKGQLEFRAQIRNRDYNNPGFMISCYDGKVKYDRSADSFKARYPTRPAGEEVGISWSRLRSPPVDGSPGDLCVVESLQQLNPGDHVEVQWRHSPLHRYGWWYARVGHARTCQEFRVGDSIDGTDEIRPCRCHLEDTVRFEFNQYSTTSRWQEAVLDRWDHQEVEVKGKGVYGGIRKLVNSQEIFAWRQQFLWEWGKKYLD
ncbi:hypothetical protein R1flu_022940 [Riccia fluitans]|uniref:F-box domain-containing protein n=1 Tax=Riccia fluitans TaxID=41844 RepID=A0ABD1XUP3_9MARC